MLGGFGIVPFLQLPMLTLAVLCAHAALMGLRRCLWSGENRIQWAGCRLLACCFFLEWFAPVDSFWRAILALVGMFALMATITVAASATPQWSVGYRLLHLLTLGYRMRAGRIRPVLSLRIVGRLIVGGWLVALPSCSSGISHSPNVPPIA